MHIIKEMVWLALGIILGYNVFLLYFMFLHDPIATTVTPVIEFLLSLAPWN